MAIRPDSAGVLANKASTLGELMLLDEATTTTHVLDRPFRVIRDGRVTLAQPFEGPPRPVVRVDLTIDGEPVTVFSRIRE